jgi:hypothetical protein
MAFKMKSPGTNILGAFTSGLREGPPLDAEYTPNSSYHLPAYAISLKDLANLQAGQSIDQTAREVAWQCVAVSKSGNVAVGEVTPRIKAPRPTGQAFNGPVRMSCVSYGPIITGAFKLVIGLAALADDLLQKFQIEGDYEPRMLRVPGLLITSIWLKSQTPGGTDWVVPLHTKINGLKPEIPLTMADFLNVVRPLAQTRLGSRIFD